MKRVVYTVLAAALCGCGAMRPLTASDADLRDYEEFALAGDAHPSARLAKAQRYLARHPDGAWAADVRRAFNEGEGVLFARAKDDRELAMSYLTDLPDGPHARQLVFVVNAFDTHEENADERSARLTEQELASAARDREAAAAWLLAAFAAVLNDTGAAYDLGLSLMKLAFGDSPPTWGERWSRDVELAYVVPAERTREPRALVARLTLRVDDGVIVAANVRGPDLFVRWAELDALRAKDEARPEDREAARAHAEELLRGMLERRFPAARCTVDPAAPSWTERACGGARVRVTVGASQGDDDALTVSAPRAQK